KIVIFGHKGQLGRDLVKLFQSECEVIGYDLPELDITNPDIYKLLDDPAPDLVINSSAYTNVDMAEKEIDKSFLVNEVGARLVADLANQWGSPVVYYSTDYVFDGMQRRPYREDDIPNPLSVYGRSKLAGEKSVIDYNPKHFILRTAWLYGPGGNNFIEKMIQRSQTAEKLEISDDEIGSPTYTWDLAIMTKKIVETQKYGLYHAVNSGECSRYHWIKTCFEYLNITVPIIPCSRAKFVLPAPRPAYSAMDNRKIRAVIEWEIPSWRESLLHYLGRRSEEIK
ncbi:MAG: dTDP-4-dehydrorhamnose reductase, partial [Candidatus Hydrogenedens sp.]